MDKIKKLLSVFGPGFVTGASDDDPTAIATYSQSGAQFGYHQLWTALYCTPFMIVAQEMCGRIGVVSGKGVATLLLENYNKYILYSVVCLLFIVNSISIGADLGAMASSGQLLVHISFIFWLIGLTLIIVLLQLFVQYKIYTRILKYAALALVTYIINALLIKQNWISILRFTVIPYISIKKEFLLNLVAILGTNISPYLFFWQTSEEVEEAVEEKKLKEVDVGKPHTGKADIKEMRTDTVIGMIFSNIVVFFIEIATATTLGTHGITQIDTPAQAAQALDPIAGKFAFLLFIVGIMGSGFLAVPVLAGSSAYAVSASFRWKQGLNKRIHQAPGFYMIIAISTVIGICINFLPIKPFQLLVYAAALNGMLTPILLVIILLIANNKKIMGKRKNSLFSNTLGIVLTVIMAVCAISLPFSFLK